VAGGRTQESEGQDDQADDERGRDRRTGDYDSAAAAAGAVDEDGAGMQSVAGAHGAVLSRGDQCVVWVLDLLLSGVRDGCTGGVGFGFVGIPTSPIQYPSTLSTSPAAVIRSAVRWLFLSSALRELR
jgi:hypothetical protein